MKILIQIVEIFALTSDFCHTLSYKFISAYWSLLPWPYPSLPTSGKLPGSLLRASEMLLFCSLWVRSFCRWSVNSPSQSAVSFQDLWGEKSGNYFSVPVRVPCQEWLLWRMSELTGLVFFTLFLFIYPVAEMWPTLQTPILGVQVFLRHVDPKSSCIPGASHWLSQPPQADQRLANEWSKGGLPDW